MVTEGSGDCHLDRVLLLSALGDGCKAKFEGVMGWKVTFRGSLTSIDCSYWQSMSGLFRTFGKAQLSIASCLSFIGLQGYVIHPDTTRLESLTPFERNL